MAIYMEVHRCLNKERCPEGSISAVHTVMAGSGRYVSR